MGCESKTREILGRRVSVTQMPASEALEVETKIAPAMLRGIVPLISVFGESDETQVDAIGKAVTNTTDALPADELVALIHKLCNPELVFIDGEGVDFDKHFSGGTGVLLRYQVVWFVLETNYSDFFGALFPEGVLERAKVKFGAKFGMTESTGDSGDPASPIRPSVAAAS